jgi:uncharacterized protein YeaO (DUF488 family)
LGQALRHNPAIAELQDIAQEAAAITLLFAAKDSARNNAVVLGGFLEGGGAAKEN